jgi:hypothetical protein
MNSLAAMVLVGMSTIQASQPPKKPSPEEMRRQIEETTRELCNTLLDANATTRQEAFEALEKVRPDLYKYLTPFVLDQREKVRINAADGLAGLGVAAKPAIGVLVAKVYESSLKIPDKSDLGYDTMDRAIYPVLKKLRPDHPNDIKLLMKIAAPETASGIHRGQALDVLGLWAGEDMEKRKQLLPLIKSGLEHDYTAVISLKLAGNYGALSKDLVPQIRKLKLSKNETFRSEATTALEKIDK